MKKLYLIILLFGFSSLIYSQKSDSITKKKEYKNYLSVDIPACFFQQVGLTYEYKTKYFGYGITAGYIYKVKHSGTSILLGDWGPGTLTSSTGFFLFPQFNYYFPKKNQDKPTSFYVGLKPLFKYAFCDSNTVTSWTRYHADEFTVKRQRDNYYAYGIMTTFGFKCVIKHFFFDMYFSVGYRHNIHKDYIVGEGNRNHAYPCTPYYSTTLRDIVALQFGINIGGVF